MVRKKIKNFIEFPSVTFKKKSMMITPNNRRKIRSSERTPEKIGGKRISDVLEMFSDLVNFGRGNDGVMRANGRLWGTIQKEKMEPGGWGTTCTGHGCGRSRGCSASGPRARAQMGGEEDMGRR
jgi:hypothetical protein